MQDFIYNTPTQVQFGRGAELCAAKALAERGAKTVFLHYGEGSIKRSGLHGRLLQSLSESGLTVVELGGVKQNPELPLIQEGIALCTAHNVDFILAVGGGSVIDSAKAISLAAGSGLAPWDIILGKEVPKKKIPLAVVLTIAAAGSEMSNSCVITNPNGRLKRGCRLEIARPELAFLNPELTFGVSPYHTACGVVDIMMHTLERYLTPDAGSELCDRISEGLLCSVRSAGIAVMADPCDYEARATLMWASSLSHNGLTGCGKTFSFPAHKISHEMSGLFGTPHGAALSVVFPAWAKYIYRYDIRKFAQLAARVFGVDFDFDCPEKTALGGIAAMIGYFSSMGMPIRMRELAIEPESFLEMAEKCTGGDQSPVPSYIPLGKKEIVEIFSLANR